MNLSLTRTHAATTEKRNVDAPQVPDGVDSDVVPVAEEFHLLDTATVMQLGAGLVTPAAVDDAFTTTKRTRGRPIRTTKKSVDAAIDTTTSTTIVTSEEEMATIDDTGEITNASDVLAGPSAEWEAQTDTGDESGEGGVAPLTLADCMRAFTAVETLGEKIVSILSVYLTVISWVFSSDTSSLMHRSFAHVAARNKTLRSSFPFPRHPMCSFCT